VRPGFRTDGLVTVELKLPRSANRSTTFLDTLLARLRALPGIQGVEATNTLPLGGAATFNGFSIVGVPQAPDRPYPTAHFRVVTPGYFAALRIPILRGRAFVDTDGRDAPAVVLVNETMERLYFAGRAVGRQIEQNSDGPAEVVGVVADIHHTTLRSAPLPEVYHPLAQAGIYNPQLAVRTALEPGAAASAIRAALAQLEPNGVVGRVKTMEQRRGESLGTSSLLIVLLGAFAALALALALIGGYGVVSYWVSRRRQEFGVRLALGAPAAGIIRLVLGETLTLVGGAVALGLAGALASTPLLANFLYGVRPTDPATMGAAVALVLATTLLAAYLPARRAAATDPVTVLRQE
jgi:predicted permease